MASKSEITRLMGMMALAWPRYELSEETIKVYYEILKDVEIEPLTDSAKQLMAAATFFPSISEWRNAAFDLVVKRLRVPSAYEAWEEAFDKMRRIGHGRTPEFSHPLIRRAIDCIGWDYLCMSESIEFERPHFYKVYDSFLSRANEEIRMLPEIRASLDAETPLLGPGISQSINLLVKGMSHGTLR